MKGAAVAGSVVDWAGRWSLSFLVQVLVAYQKSESVLVAAEVPAEHFSGTLQQGTEPGAAYSVCHP